MLHWLLKWRRERYVYKWYASRVRAGFTQAQIGQLASNYDITLDELQTAKYTWLNGRGQ